MSTLYIGVDIARSDFEAAWWDGATRQARRLGRFANDPSGFTQFSAQVQRLQHQQGRRRVHLVAEPTGGYEQRLVEHAQTLHWRVSLPNPRQVRDWAKGAGVRAKTDRCDARVLASFAAQQRPPAQAPLPPEVQALESLLRRREDLEKMLRQERNRQGAVAQRPGAAEAVGASLAGMIEALEAAQAEIEQAIEEHLRQYPQLGEQAHQLRQLPGVGAKNVLPLLVVLHRWHAYTQGAGEAKGLTAYVGLDPQPYQSGSSVYRPTRISRQGNRRMRQLLYMGALGGTRGHNRLRAFYQRLVARGKPKKVALVAAAHKILVWAWACFRSLLAAQPAPQPAIP